MTKRARLLSVLGILAGGLFGLIASTQTWLDATINDGAAEPIHVAGAGAIALMAPLSLAAIAAAITLAIAGVAFRYVLGALAVIIGAAMLVMNVRLITGASALDVAAAVTEATGIAGDSAIIAMVTELTLTPWVTVTVVAWLLITAGGLLTLVTAKSWAASGKKYRTSTAGTAHTGPLDKIDSWDDLSRGEDPTQSV
ncbi:Trp biosynthesis-associated membrane protein [Microbacterium sp. YY-03]|uniref:Trp biosynthesis-associated membrane protein n=1 Tax=Microbacterium sp. YY-03 TaxID=3421636 RepID=UPI003D16F12E